MADYNNIFNQLFGSSQTDEAVINSPFVGMGRVDNLVQKTKGDKVIWAIVVLLTLASLLLVYSSTGSLAYRMSKSTESYLFKQFAFIILGLLVIYWAHRINYTIYSKVAKFLFSNRENKQIIVQIPPVQITLACCSISIVYNI